MNFILIASMHLSNESTENFMSSALLGCDFVTSLMISSCNLFFICDNYFILPSRGQLTTFFLLIAMLHAQITDRYLSFDHKKSNTTSKLKLTQNFSFLKLDNLLERCRYI